MRKCIADVARTSADASRKPFLRTMGYLKAVMGPVFMLLHAWMKAGHGLDRIAKEALLFAR